VTSALPEGRDRARIAMPRDAVGIGASAGGIEALIVLLGVLPREPELRIAIVVHRGARAESRLAAVLQRGSSMPVREPEDGEPFASGNVYLAPSDRHIEVSGGRFQVHRGPHQHFTRPAIDPLFHSLASEYGERSVGVLLSGMGDDGVSGMVAIKARGGITLVQDPAEARFGTLPHRAILFDHVDAVLPVRGIATALLALAHGEEPGTQTRRDERGPSLESEVLPRS
jgi:two-component system chemotaxis response regulator CheB